MKILHLIEFVLFFKRFSKIRKGVTEKGCIKNICKRCISCYSKVVPIDNNIKLLSAYSEFTLQMQDQILSKLICRNRSWVFE